MAERYYRGDHPCPGCGKPEPRWGKNNICGDCSNFIKLGKEVKAQPINFSQISLAWYNLQALSLKNDKEQLGRTGGLIYISDTFDKVGSSRSLRDTLKAFLDTLSEGKKASYELSVFMDDSPYDEKIVVKTETAKAFFEFYKALGEYCKKIDEEAFARGNNLLFGLNDGSVSLEEFNKRINKK